MKKYTIRILFDIAGWAYYHRACALKKYAPEDFEVSIGSDYGKALKEKPHDLVFQLAYSYAKPLREHQQKGKYNFLIASSFNVGWGYNNDWLNSTLKYSDAVIINNFEMWDKSGRKPKTYHISNGVDRSVFYPIVPFQNRRPKVLWCGSIIHKNIKGYSDILLPLQNQLKRKGITMEVKLSNSMAKTKLTPPQMSQWYNSGTIYVVASKNEGTPNPALEAASCGCPVVSTHVGNMPELIKQGENGYLCERKMSDIYEYILKVNSDSVRMSERMLQEIDSWDWKYRSKQFFDLFRNLIESRK